MKDSAFPYLDQVLQIVDEHFERLRRSNSRCSPHSKVSTSHDDAKWLYDFADLIGHNRQRDLAAIGLAARQRLGEV